MPEETKVLPEEITPEVNETETTDTQMSVKEIIRNLIADGARRINNVRIKNVNYDKDYEDKNYIRVSLTLDKNIPGYVPVTNSNGDTIGYEKGMTNIIYTSTFALGAVLKEDEDTSWLAGHIVDKPKRLGLIFNGATIDILQREYAKGTPISNPFSTRKDKDSNVYDHDIIINDVISITLGKAGNKMAMMLASNILMED